MNIHRAPQPLCHVLREDPELAEAIDPGRREQAVAECTAREVWFPAGIGDAPGSLAPAGGIGLLMLEGLVIRRVGVDERGGAELLGEGDVLRPCGPESSALVVASGWTVIEPTRFAVLDAEFVQRFVRYPELAVSLVDRALQRSRMLAVNMAIVHQARVDVRLHMLLWHLAGRWGRVRSDGTVLPVRLTHVVLADLVAARRPTVTSALSDLARRGLVRWEEDAWLLSGEPPCELLELAPRASNGAGSVHAW